MTNSGVPERNRTSNLPLGGESYIHLTTETTPRIIPLALFASRSQRPLHIELIWMLEAKPCYVRLIFENRTHHTGLLDIELIPCRADNFFMGLKKVITLLVGLCVLLAPVLSSAAVFSVVPVAQVQEVQADCHAVKTVDDHETHHDVHQTSTKAAHTCCFNIVGVLSGTNLVKADARSSELIPFSPSLTLISRAEGLYRPPR